MSLSDDERTELRTAARGLLGTESTSERVRRAVASAEGFDQDLWDQMVELGWTTIHLAEHHGGAGYGYEDLAVVLHELGRALAPSPFLASAVLASGALALAENQALASELLEPIAGGNQRGSVAFASAVGSYDRARLTMSWISGGGSLRLSGASSFVLDADIADVIVVAARHADDGTIAAVAVDGANPALHIERAPSVDETRRLFSVSLDGVEVGDDRLLASPGPHSAELLDRVLALGAIAVACDATGVAEVALERAAQHATSRIQFGKPIGSFQAVKHHCANMAISVEASRAASRAAAVALDGDPDRWADAASIAASYVGPACSDACALALLVYGGIGFTWEHDSHLLLKRAKLDEVLFGTPRWHRQRLADAVFSRVTAGERA